MRSRSGASQGWTALHPWRSLPRRATMFQVSGSTRTGAKGNVGGIGDLIINTQRQVDRLTKMLLTRHQQMPSQEFIKLSPFLHQNAAPQGTIRQTSAPQQQHFTPTRASSSRSCLGKKHGLPPLPGCYLYASISVTLPLPRRLKLLLTSPSRWVAYPPSPLIRTGPSRSLGRATPAPEPRRWRLHLRSSWMGPCATVARRCWAERIVRIMCWATCGTQLTLGTAYVQKWIEVYRQRDAGNRPALMKALREATRGFVGVTDVPAVDFIGELIELYPNVKVSRACPPHASLSSIYCHHGSSRRNLREWGFCLQILF